MIRGWFCLLSWVVAEKMRERRLSVLLAEDHM